MLQKKQTKTTHTHTHTNEYRTVEKTTLKMLQFLRDVEVETELIYSPKAVKCMKTKKNQNPTFYIKNKRDKRGKVEPGANRNVMNWRPPPFAPQSSSYIVFGL